VKQACAAVRTDAVLGPDPIPLEPVPSLPPAARCPEPSVGKGTDSSQQSPPVHGERARRQGAPARRGWDSQAAARIHMACT